METFLVKADPSGGGPQQPSVMELSANDCVMPQVYTRLLYFYSPNTAPPLLSTAAVRASLARLLALFPLLAGTLRSLDGGKLQVAIDPASDAVALVTSTSPAPVTFASLQAANFNPREFPRDCDFAPLAPLPAPRPDLGLPAEKVPLFAAQSTRLADGGAVLCVCVHHALCDGRGTFAAVAAWARLHRAGLEAAAEQPEVEVGAQQQLLVHERAPLHAFVATTPPPIDCPPMFILRPPAPPPPAAGASDATPATTRVLPPCEGRMLAFSAMELAGIKAAAEAALDRTVVPWISTADALGAHVWRAATRARMASGQLPLPTDALLRFGFAVDARLRLDPPLPLTYTGNANVYGVAAATLAALVDPSAEAAAAAAAAVRLAVRGVDARACARSLAWVAAQPDRTRVEPSFRTFLGPDWAATSWSEFEVYGGADFGGGAPARLRVPRADFDGLMIVMPPAPGTDGVEVLVGLTAAAWRAVDADAGFRRWRPA